MTTPTLEELLREGGALLRSGQRERARALLGQAVRADPRSEQAWLLLAGAVTDLEQRRTCLERVLRLNPAHPIAQKALATLPPPAAPAQPQAPEPVAPPTAQPAMRSTLPQPQAPEPVAPPTAQPAMRSTLPQARAPEPVAPPTAQPAMRSTLPVTPPVAPQPHRPAVAPAPPAVVETIPLGRPAPRGADAVTIALSEEAIRRAAAERRQWAWLLALGIAMMLVGAAVLIPALLGG